MVVYFAHSSTFLIDRSVADLTTGEAIAIAAGGLALAWIVYDTLCRMLKNEWLLALAVLGFIVLAAWGSSSFSPPARPISRSARCSGRSWPRTSSS